MIAALLMGAAMIPAQAQNGRMAVPSVGVGTANPSAIVAAELGLARLAREEGQWTALRDLADKDAVLFTPGAVNAQKHLKGRANPENPARWSPAEIFISCDGTYGIAVGELENPDGSRKQYAAVWRQQRKGDYKWVMRFDSDTLAPAGSAVDDLVPIKATVATCPRRASRMPNPASARGKGPRFAEVVRIGDPPPAAGAGHSADGTMRWTWGPQDSVQTFELFIQRAQGEERVLHLRGSATPS